MKLRTFFVVAVNALSVTPALACLEVVGAADITTGSLPWETFENVLYAYAVDNGVVTCDERFGISTDQNGNFALTCIPNFAFAFKKDLSFGWYSNPSNSFSFYLNPYVSAAGGSTIQWTFDDRMFGC
jgi:hypothetical protein